MHFAYTRAAGVWIAGTVVQAAEGADLDAKTYKAINGDDGGAWAPAAPIEISGAGLQLQGADLNLFDGLGNSKFLFDASVPSIAIGCVVTQTDAHFTFSGTGNVSIGAARGFACQADATFTGVVNCTGNVTLGNAVGDTITISGTPTIAEDATFSKAVSVGDTLNALHDATLGSSAADALNVVSTSAFAAPTTFSGATNTFTKPVVLSSNGRIRYRVTAGADANTTYSVADWDEIYVADTTLSAGRVYTLADAASGERIRITNWDVGDQIDVKRADASAICSLKSAGGFYRSVDFICVSGVWQIGMHHYA